MADNVLIRLEFNAIMPKNIDIEELIGNLQMSQSFCPRLRKFASFESRFEVSLADCAEHMLFLQRLKHARLFEYVVIVFIR